MINKEIYAYRKYLFFLAEVTVFVLLILFYNNHTALLPQRSKLYSTYLPFRLQTNALLQGKLSLSPQPFGLHYDFDYTELGMQQNSGLGVPFLRLPFEWLASVTGYGYFPDRVTLLFYLTGLIVMMNRAFGSLLSEAGLGWFSKSGFIVRWCLLGWFLFSPPMSGLIQYRFRVYEEAVFYGCMCSGLLLAVFWMYMQKQSGRIFILLCLISGFAWIVRPTLIFYGAVSVALAIVYDYRYAKNIRRIIIGIPCFLLGVGVNLALNYLRFGSMTEFGYATNVNSPTGEFVQKFADPFYKETIWNASKELLSALFFNHRYLALEHYRLRQFSFDVFNASHLLVLAAGACLLAFILLSKILRIQGLLNMNRRCFRMIGYSLAWGILCFGSLFIFYAHSLSMTSRYLSEFSTAYFAVLSALIILGCILANYFPESITKKVVVSLLLTGGILIFLMNNREFFKYQSNKWYVTSGEDIKRKVDSFDRKILRKTPVNEALYCGRSSLPIKYNAQSSGWNISGDCLVSDSTSLFFPARRCLTLNYSVLNDGNYLDVRVKRGIVFLKSQGSRVSENEPGLSRKDTVTQRFCSESFIPGTISLYSIGWIKADKIKLMDEILDVKLNWVNVGNEE